MMLSEPMLKRPSWLGEMIEMDWVAGFGVGLPETGGLAEGGLVVGVPFGLSVVLVELLAVSGVGAFEDGRATMIITSTTRPMRP